MLSLMETSSPDRTQVGNASTAVQQNQVNAWAML
jgi:hypothetical protein